jgi:diacylglycerol kinase family enzyme
VRTLAIVNPGAGRRRVGAASFQELWQEMRPLLEDAGFTFDMRETGDPEPDAGQLAACAVRDGYRAVLVAGGDGTVAAAARALLDTPVVLAILPFGSVMNIANSIPLPLDPLEAARVIARRNVRRIDVGAVDGTVFFETAGIGLDADVFGAGRSLERGELPGAMARLRQWFRQRSRWFSITVDGRGPVRHRALQALVTNGRYYAFSLPVVPDADISDGLLDVAVFRRMGRLDLLRFLLTVAWRRAPEVRPVVYHGREIKIESSVPLAVHADGFEVGTLPMTFRCRHQALTVFA